MPNPSEPTRTKIQLDKILVKQTKALDDNTKKLDEQTTRLGGIDTKLGDHTTKLDSMNGNLAQQIGKLDGIKGELDQHTVKYDGIQSELNKHTGKLSGIDAALGAQTGKLGEQTTKLGGIDTKLGYQTAKLDSMNGNLAQQIGKLNVIQGELSQHTVKYDGIQGELNKHTGKLSGIDAALGAQTGKLDEQTAKLGGIDTKLGDQTAKLDNMNGSLAQQISKLDGIQGALGQHTVKYDGIQGELNKHTGKLSGIDAALGAQTGKLDEQTAKLGGIDTKLGDQTAKLDNLNGNLAQQIGKLDGIQGALGQHTVKYDGIQGELNKHTGKLGGIDATLGAQTGKLDEQTAKLGGIDTKLGNQTAKLDNMNGNLAQQIGKLDGIQGALGQHTVKYDGIQGELNKHTGKLGGIDAALGAQTGKLDEQTVKLGGIDSKLGNLEDSLAPAVTLNINAQGADVDALQGKLTKLGVSIPQHELNAKHFGIGTQSALRKLQEKYRLPRTGMLDAETNAALEGAVSGAEANQRIEGRAFFQDGRPASGINLRLYKRTFGGGATNIKEFTADGTGFYSFEHDEADKSLNLEVRAVDPGDSLKDYPLSLTKHGAGKHEVMNLLVPTSLRKLEPEYNRLSTEIEKHIGNISNLKDAQESDNQQDLTLLHRSTGWDARLIGLAANAAKVGFGTGLDQGMLYALFRAGLPTDLEQLARLGSVAVDKALHKTVSAGIVDLTDQQIAQAKGTFETFARKERRKLKLAGTASSFGDFLSKSGLEDENQKDAFENAYFARRGADHDLWGEVGKELKATGLDQSAVDEKIKGLRLQGKLGYLSLNSNELTESLKTDVTDPDQMDKLVDLGLYNETAWKNRLKATAGNDDAKLQKMIPSAYLGEDVKKRLDGYSADLARKVRLNYPTQVVTRMFQKDEMLLGPEHAAMKAPVTEFLANAQKLGFELGRKPVEAFVREHKDELFQATVSNDEVDGIVKTVKKVQRIYQVTPTNEAMAVLLELGFTSALDVLAFPYDVFMQRFGYLFPSQDEARWAYRKAEQVTPVTHSFFSAAKQLDTTPGIHALSPPASARESAKADLIKRFPTMESLFGSLDYCECEHCRSVLSPAAYLVDLLQFLEPDDLVWESFLTDWSNKHDGDQYKSDWKRPDGSSPPPLERKPYHALIERRPDLPHLPLTCENTHTALPYIDVVNEILEYYVANGKLKDDAAYDTGSATTGELLAEPQNIHPTAYQELNEARYPLAWTSMDTPSSVRLGLPFDLWLEMVRRFLDHFDTPLADVLEAFRKSESLFHADGSPYGYASVFVESLGLSPMEHAIFGAPNPLSDWFKMYGYESEAHALQGVKKSGLALDAETIDRFELYSTPPIRFAKTLSRRLGVTYREVVELVSTSFINPKLDSLVFLRKLNIDIRDVFRYKEQTNYPKLTDEEKADFESQVKALSHEDNYGEVVFGDQDALSWLNETWDQGGFNDVLVLADPSTVCDFEASTLRYADGRDVGTLTYHKLNLLVRLWRKLGWTLEETDHALQVFLPTELQPLTEANLGSALKTALVYFAAFEELVDRLETGIDWRRKLLTFWSNLSTTGKKPLYAELFLTASVLKDVKNKVFDNPLGIYLQFDTNKESYVKEHLLTLQAGLNLTADEIGEILQDAKRDDLLSKFAADKLSEDQVEKNLTEDPPAVDSAKLTLESVSLLYRYGILAKGLKLSVREMIALKVLSGIDPFKPLEPTELSDIEKDHPFKQTLRFVKVAEHIKDAGLSIENLEYLLRHRFDPIGKYRFDGDHLLTLVNKLAIDLRRIEQAHSVPTDKENLTDEFLQIKLAHILEPTAADEILGTLASLQSVAKSLIEQHLGKFLSAADIEKLLGDIVAVDRRLLLAERILPLIRQQLSRQLIVQTLSAEQEAEVQLIEALLTDVNLIADPSDHTRPLITAYFMAQQKNLSQEDLERIRSAHIVLVKTLQITNDLGLTHREVRYLLTHKDDFGGLDLTKLPTQPISESSRTLFEPLYCLVEYVLLRRKLGDTDDLIIVFEKARRRFPGGTDEETAKDKTLDDVSLALSEITRRDLVTVRNVAEMLGCETDSTLTNNELQIVAALCTNTKGIERIWKCLEFVQKLGVSPSSIAGWTGIVDSTKSPEDRLAIAQEIKHMIKARYESENWQRIAGSIFDRLRQEQRDVLVAYVMHKKGFDRIEQLFEHFLVDPGMEPVVQTSRVQLAISSVQLFIQRCLLNLEDKVHASTINAKHWQWMKRYRVWEANRKIWLFPENWLEPEFRDDKTHLFRELEGALLQDDITDERAEDAFFTYLKKLEVLARLEIVAMYCEEKPLDPNSNMLHVIGRTYNAPHSYFYRRYAHQMWTPWEPVDAVIEGDHITAVMWRGRLHLFWVTFLKKAVETENEGQTLQEMAEISMSELKPNLEVQVQLNWSEYAHSEWSTRETSSIESMTVKVGKTFDSSAVFVHVSTEFADDGTERAVLIHLGSPIGRAFRLVSKNSAPQNINSGAPPDLPYQDTKPAISAHFGKGGLKVKYTDRIVEVDSVKTQVSTVKVDILQKNGDYRVLAPANDIELPTKEIGALVTPFFYQDNLNTFFVEPIFDEETIERWEEWVIPVPAPDPIPEEDWWWEYIPLDPFIPLTPEENRPWPLQGQQDEPIPDFLNTLDPGTIFEVMPGKDWATDPSTVLQFGKVLLGKGGSLDPQTVKEIALTKHKEIVLNVDAGGNLSLSQTDADVDLAPGVGDALGYVGASSGGVLITAGKKEKMGGTVSVAGKTLNIVTNSGLNPGALANMDLGNAFEHTTVD